MCVVVESSQGRLLIPKILEGESGAASERTDYMEEKELVEITRWQNDPKGERMAQSKTRANRWIRATREIGLTAMRTHLRLLHGRRTHLAAVEPGHETRYEV